MYVKCPKKKATHVKPKQPQANVTKPTVHVFRGHPKQTSGKAVHGPPPPRTQQLQQVPQRPEKASSANAPAEPVRLGRNACPVDGHFNRNARSQSPDYGPRQAQRSLALSSSSSNLTWQAPGANILGRAPFTNFTIPIFSGQQPNTGSKSSFYAPSSNTNTTQRTTGAPGARQHSANQ